MNRALIEGVMLRQARLRQAAERADDAILARNRRQEMIRQAFLAGATPLPLKPTAQELERRITLVDQALAFVAAAKAAGVIPLVETADAAHVLRVRSIFFRLTYDADRLCSRAKERHYVGEEFRAIEDTAREYAQAIRKAEADGATIAFEPRRSGAPWFVYRAPAASARSM